jgi:glucose-6-phosphate isomerase
MIKLDIERFSTDSLKSKLEEIKTAPLPSFHTHKPDLDAINSIAKKHSKFRNFLLLSNGGSRTSALAFYNFSNKQKRFEFIATIEPSYLFQIAQKYQKNDTLVIPISKSGTNVMPLEALFFFMQRGYEVLLLTSKDRGVLKEIGDAKGYKIAVHPDVGGRYSGRTMCGLLPASLMGLDISKINNGANAMYKICNPKVPISKNPALRLAAYLYLQEQKGCRDVLIAAYSMKFYSFIPLIVQLGHESFGKAGKGLSFFGDFGPEIQHHTNQRLYGGRKNMVGLYIGVKTKPDVRIAVPKPLQRIQLRTGTLGDLDKLSLSKALLFDLEANLGELKRLKIPHAYIEVQKEDEYTCGEFLALMQYTTVYSSLLRNVNPYDQPAVEASKDISWEMTKRVKR